MTKWTDWLRRLTSNQEPEKESVESPEILSNIADGEAWQYLQRVREKASRLVEALAQGHVNRAQFEELYAHYQKERRAVERLLMLHPSSDAWRTAVTEGESVDIRRRLAARVLGYAVYANRDRGPLRVCGEFATLNHKWVLSLLARLGRENDEPYVVGRFDTGGEDAACLCVVPGELAMLIVLFTSEPASVQVQLLEDLHRHFEQANHRVLARPLYQVSDLVFPYAAALE
jgi:hypothetical protein